MPIDLLFEHAEALGYLRGRLRFAVRRAGGRTADGVGRDDGDFLAKVFGHLVDCIGLNRMELLQEAEEQQSRTQSIDLPRDPSGVPVNQRKAIVGEFRIPLPICPAQPVLDIRLGLGFAQRSQMVGRGHALAQLLQPRTAENGAELRLPKQKTLQRHGPVDYDVGQHAQLFEGLEGQVLRLVDDQQYASAVALLRQHEVVDALQQ